MSDVGIGEPEPGDAPHRGGLRRLRRVALLLAVMLGAIDLAATTLLFVNISNEADQRKIENCKLFVGRWRADVQQVAQTANYLESLTRVERRTSLNRRVAANLPTTIDRAVVERPPKYCAVGTAERIHARVLLHAARRQAARSPTPRQP